MRGRTGQEGQVRRNEKREKKVTIRRVGDDERKMREETYVDRYAGWCRIEGRDERNW
jgi:hypothetical protein